MSRQETPICDIRCVTDTQTMRAIALTCGLEVVPGSDEDLFHLANSGRSNEPEVGRELGEVVENALRQAHDEGIIPSWSIVRHNV